MLSGNDDNQLVEVIVSQSNISAWFTEFSKVPFAPCKIMLPSGMFLY